MKTLFSYCCIGLVSISLLWGQIPEQSYVMTALGAEIGSLQCFRQIQGDDTYYHNKTLLEVNLIFKKIRMEVDFEGEWF